MAPDSLHFSRKDRWIIRLVRLLGPLLIRLIGATWRVTWRGTEREKEAIQAHGSVVFAFWHSQILIPTYLYRHRNIRVMVSQSKDGELISCIIKALGFMPIRGSTSRRGLRAFTELAAAGKKGHLIGITPDGPRVPCHQAQIGVAMLAKRAGLPIIPLAMAAQKQTNLNSWDRFCIPHPFSRVVFLVGDPIAVTRDLNKDQLEEKRQEIETIMQNLQAEADHFFDRK